MADSKKDIDHVNESIDRPLDPSLFDPPLDKDYICSICLHVLYRPISLTCPHLFCQACIKKNMEVKDEKKSFECPECRKVTADIDVGERGINVKFNHYINGKFKLNCPNKCGTVLECLGTNPERERLIEHLKECTHQIIECDLCDEKMLRMALIVHKNNKCMERMVECDYCKKKMTEKNRIDHLESPPSASSPTNTDRSFCVIPAESTLGCINRSYCPNKTNGCAWIGLNEELNDHINQCDKEIISCTICDKKIFRELLSSHNNDAAAIHLIIQRLEKQFEEKIRQEQERLGAREEKMQEIIERLEKQLADQKKQLEKRFEEKEEKMNEIIQRLEKQLDDQKSENNKINAINDKMNEKIQRLEKQSNLNEVSCTLTYALPVNSIKPKQDFYGKMVSLTDSLNVRLNVEIDEKENVGLYLMNHSSSTILATSVIGQLLQWKDNKFVDTKNWSLENQPIPASKGYGWSPFIPTANWKNASSLDDWTSSLPPSDSSERKLFDINEADGTSNGRYLLFVIKASVGASLNINGKNETNHALVKVLKELKQ